MSLVANIKDGEFKTLRLINSSANVQTTFENKMLKNLELTNGIIFSQRVMLKLTNHGFSREKAYKIVQKHAQNSWKNDTTFYKSLTKDNMITNKIHINDLKKMFDINYHTKKIDLIYRRIFK